MNKNKISKIIITSFVALNIFTSNTFAINKQDIYDEILSAYSNRTEHDIYLLNMLKNVGYSDIKHKMLLDNIKKYIGSNTELWWLIESNRLIFDDIIFLIPEIQKNYIDKVQNYGQSEIYAKSVIKRELIGNAEELDITFKTYLESCQDSTLESIFEKRFNRKPTLKELSWMKKSETIKYSLYGGVLQREISLQEQQEIESGHGYKLLGLSENEANEYKKLIQEHNNTEIQEVYHKRAYQGLNNIKNIIEEYYGINIFNILNLSERDNIYISATIKYKFDERKALEFTLDKLKEKGLIKDSITDWPDDIIKPEIPQNKPSQDNYKPGINDDFTTSNPTGSLNNHIQNLNKNNIYKALTSSISDLYKKVRIGNLKGDYIFFKYNMSEYDTNIKLKEDDTITNEQTKSVLKIVAKELKGKIAEGKAKTMILVNNSIAIKEKSKEDKVSFDELKMFFNKLKIEIFKKYKE